MFCCLGHSSVVISPSEPEFKDGDKIPVLWLGSKRPDITALPVETYHSPFLWGSSNIYHVSSLKQFHAALVGLSFSARVNQSWMNQKIDPRRFNVVVVADWTNPNLSTVTQIFEKIIAYQELFNSHRPLFISESSALDMLSDKLSLVFDFAVDELPHKALSDTSRLITSINPTFLNESKDERKVLAIATASEDSYSTKRSLSTLASPKFSELTPESSTRSKWAVSSKEKKFRQLKKLSLAEFAKEDPRRFTTASTEVSSSAMYAASALPQFRTGSKSIPFSNDPLIDLFKHLSDLAKTPAESASVNYHQIALLEAFNMERLLGRGLSVLTAINFRKAILYSDMGKLNFYKKWFTELSENSTALLNSLQLRDDRPLTTFLGKLTNGKPFINPSLSHEEIRCIFKAIPLLIGYFHEFQGMRVAETELFRHSINERSFHEIILGFYGHNGPGDFSFKIDGEACFWSQIPYLIKAQLQKLVREDILPEKALSFFEGTSFMLADGSLKYHDPQSAFGYEHMIFDRFDGYRNSIKIREEICFLPPIEAEVESLLGPNYNTLIALRYDLEVLLPKLLADGIITEEDYNRLAKSTEDLIERTKFIHQIICELLPDAESLKENLNHQRSIPEIKVCIPPSSYSLEPKEYIFTKESIGHWSDESAKSFRDFIDQHVRLHVMTLDRNRFGIYEK